MEPQRGLPPSAAHPESFVVKVLCRAYPAQSPTPSTGHSSPAAQAPSPGPQPSPALPRIKISL